MKDLLGTYWARSSASGHECYHHSYPPSYIPLGTDPTIIDMYMIYIWKMAVSYLSIPRRRTSNRSWTSISLCFSLRSSRERGEGACNGFIELLIFYFITLFSKHCFTHDCLKCLQKSSFHILVRKASFYS